LITPDHVKPTSRIGIQTLTSGLLLVGAVVALAVLDKQIQIYGLSTQWPNARTFPMLILGVLALAVLVRLGLNWKQIEAPIGPVSQMARVVALMLAIGTAVAIMPYWGFFSGAIVAAVGTSLALNERRLVMSLGLSLVLAIIVTYGARHGLSIPLP